MFSVHSLVKKIEGLKQSIGVVVDGRMREFRSNKEHMSELCFCLLTANYTAEGGIRIQKEMGDFSGLSASQIEKELRRLGYRFPKVRAGYISIAQDYRNDLCRLSCMESSMERRKWLVENIKGLGYKEASHFLRNIGYDDVAIIDRHIIRVLEEHQLIPSTKSISPKKYLEIEEILSVLAHKSGTSLGELDLYLWYLKTGKILK